MILGSIEELPLRASAAIPASHRHARVAGLDRRCKSILAAESTLFGYGKSTSLLFPTCILHLTLAVPTLGCGPTSHFIWFSRSAWHIEDFDLRITWGFTEGIDLVFTIAGLVCFYIYDDMAHPYRPSVAALPTQNLTFAFLPSL